MCGDQQLFLHYPHESGWIRRNKHAHAHRLMPSGPEKSVCIPTVLHTPVLCTKFSDDTASLIAAKCFQHLFAACLSWANVFDDNFQDTPHPPLLCQKKTRILTNKTKKAAKLKLTTASYTQRHTHTGNVCLLIFCSLFLPLAFSLSFISPHAFSQENAWVICQRREDHLRPTATLASQDTLARNPFCVFTELIPAPLRKDFTI